MDTTRQDVFTLDPVSSVASPGTRSAAGMSDQHAPDDPLARLYALADLVRSDLAIAGIPLVPDYLHGGHPLGPVGAHVFAVNLGHRGVFIRWVSHSILKSASLEAWSEGRSGPDNPAGQWNNTIDAAMQNAMATILSSIGYEVVTVDDDSGAELIVTQRAAEKPLGGVVPESDGPSASQVARDRGTAQG
ncbi:hypothetical protein F9C11_07135 [Amycolatopsis sp. VS8301801F10]|uniref:hypothetical protein n=1 Tax=Amycolatopsis sp. VS8301801F10 TaxID=2652442 RepID=UPI0038FBE814